MSSRSYDDLLPGVAELCRKWVAACKALGVDVLVYCTYRPPEEQDVLYAQGRTMTGPVVTWARAWQSWHQMRRAWDAVPILAGKPLWGYAESLEQWRVMVDQADLLGIEWAGRWDRHREMCHWQVSDGLTLDEAREEAQRVVA